MTEKILLVQMHLAGVEEGANLRLAREHHSLAHPHCRVARPPFVKALTHKGTVRRH